MSFGVTDNSVASSPLSRCMALRAIIPRSHFISARSRRTLYKESSPLSGGNAEPVAGCDVITPSGLPGEFLFSGVIGHAHQRPRSATYEAVPKIHQLLGGDFAPRFGKLSTAETVSRLEGLGRAPGIVSSRRAVRAVASAPGVFGRGLRRAVAEQFDGAQRRLGASVPLRGQRL